MTRRDEIAAVKAMLREQARCGHCDGDVQVTGRGNTGSIRVLVRHGRNCPAARGVVDERAALGARVAAALDAGGYR
ncbi:hypothetical protein KVH27_27955 [Streptomyces olivaceus]|uniref:hypothetical protein n=1 Tax=Streptomyces olivaceus TaxID=47716 RepID=UPI001CCDA486|nr:hypothetical protein [Streptomyces olivaceus]MBZ6252186.1 hypothetical protein [Streptomyces olivaceus]